MPAFCVTSSNCGKERSLESTDLAVGEEVDPWAIPCPSEFFADSNIRGTKQQNQAQKRRDAAVRLTDDTFAHTL